MTARLLPGLDDELTAALAHVEELLLEVVAWEEDDPDTTWPAPLGRWAGPGSGTADMGHGVAYVRAAADEVATPALFDLVFEEAS